MTVEVGSEFPGSAGTPSAIAAMLRDWHGLGQSPFAFSDMFTAKSGAVVNVKSNGAKGDCQKVTGAVTIAATLLTLVGAVFVSTAAEAGKVITIQKAGAASAPWTGTIVSVPTPGGNQCVLSGSPSTNPAGASREVSWGTNDTAAISSLILTVSTLAPGGKVILDAGSDYLVVRDPATSFTYQQAWISAVLLQSNVTFDLNGATITLADTGGLRCHAIGVPGVGITNAKVVGPGTIDCQASATTFATAGQGRQTMSASGEEIVGLGLVGTTDCYAGDIQFLNCSDFGTQLLHNTRLVTGPLTVRNSEGSGHRVGNTGSDASPMDNGGGLENHDCTFGPFTAYRCMGARNLSIGSPVVGVNWNCSFAANRGFYCAGGHKLENTSRGIVVNYSGWVGGVDPETGNDYGRIDKGGGGTKTQGTSALSLYPFGVHYNFVYTENAPAMGLYCSLENHAVSVGMYYGKNNCTSGTNQTDLEILSAIRIQSAVIEDCGHNTYAVRIATVLTTEQVRIGNIVVINRTKGPPRAVQLESGAVDIDHIRAVDYQGSPTLLFMIRNTASPVGNVTGAVGRLSSNLGITATRFPYFAGDAAPLAVGPFALDGVANSFLVQATTSTSLDTFLSDAIGRFSNGSTYIQSDIDYKPQNTAGRALTTRAILLNAGAAGTNGVTFEHSTSAAGAEKWRGKNVGFYIAPHIGQGSN